MPHRITDPMAHERQRATLDAQLAPVRQALRALNAPFLADAWRRLDAFLTRLHDEYERPVSREWDPAGLARVQAAARAREALRRLETSPWPAAELTAEAGRILAQLDRAATAARPR